MKINGIEVDRGKFIGRIKVRADGKVQVVTETTDGNESIMWASWEYIKQVVEDVLAERAQDKKDDQPDAASVKARWGG